MNTTSASGPTPPPQPQNQQQGNLELALTEFDHSHKVPKQPLSIKPQPQPSILTINIPDQEDTCGDGERERSLTLGSEFDIDWALEGKDGKGIISGLLTPVGGGERGEPIVTVGDGGMSSEGTSTTEISASTASSVHYNTALIQHDTPAKCLPQLPEENTTHYKSATAAAKDSNSSNNNKEVAPAQQASIPPPQLWTSLPDQSQQCMSPVRNSKGPARQELSNLRTGVSFGNNNYKSTTVPEKVVSSGSSSWQQQRLASPVRERGDSTASQFLKGLYQQQLPPPQVHPSSSGIVAHTPPTQMGTSYENSHFGKRMRAGSISGRLRSASYLEDKGVISQEQKAILRDLIIAGDNSVQGAIDKYEAGDASVLEDMIRSGALLSKSSDVDLLGDLDLEFLNVHGGGGDDDGHEGMLFGIMDDFDGEGNTTKSNAIEGGEYNDRQTVDGIGDLEFNGYFPNSCISSARQAAGIVNSNSQNTHAEQPIIVHSKSRENSIDCLEVHRTRANSLAFPGMLLDDANLDDGAQITFGRWMDKIVPLQPHTMQIMQRTPSVQVAPTQQKLTAPNSIGVSRNRNVLKPTQVSSECNDLMASKSRRGKSYSAAQAATASSTHKVNRPKVKKEKIKKKPSAKERKESRERKSHSKMKDMMESINGGGNTVLTGDDNVTKGGPTTGQGRPRSMSDPSLSVRLDDHGLLHVNGPEGWVGAYSPDSRQLRIRRYMEKRNHRVFKKVVKYDVRKNFADSRLRVKGRFVKKEDEMLMRELMSLT